MSGRIPISVVIVTRNEAANIRACLERLTRFAEIFVVDSSSADATPFIARELGAHVVPFVWNGRYPKKRQWCLDNLTFAHDWVLWVDADELLGQELVDEIETLMRDGPKAAGYFMRFDNSFLGRRLRFGLQNFKLVLLDRHRTRYPTHDDLEATGMGEIEGHYQPFVLGPVGALRHRALHLDAKNLSQFIDRLNRYSDWEAIVRSKPRPTESQFSGRALLKHIFNRMPAKSLAMFLYCYVVRLGFLDGRAGLAFAASRFWYYWMVALKQRELRIIRAKVSHETAKSLTT